MKKLALAFMFILVGCSNNAVEIMENYDPGPSLIVEMTQEKIDYLTPRVAEVHTCYTSILECTIDEGRNFTGTAFIIDKDDSKTYLMTNHHVIKNLVDEDILEDWFSTIAFQRGVDNHIEAQVEYIEEGLDLAILSIDELDGISEPIPLADTINHNNYNVEVYTMGYPLGHDKIEAAGQFKPNSPSLDFNFYSYDYDWDEYYVDGTPGRSGSPYINEDNELIGVLAFKQLESEYNASGGPKLKVVKDFIDNWKETM